LAHSIAKEDGSEQKRKQLADLSFTMGPLNLALVEQCLISAEDIGGLLLLYTSTGNAGGIEKLAKMAVEKGKNNVAFVCLFLLHRLEDCLNLLCDTGRIPEAAFLARTYLPSHVSRIVKLWKQDLQSINQKAAESLADPMEYTNLFPDLDMALKAEQHFQQGSQTRPASIYPDVRDELNRHLIDEIRSLSGVEGNIHSKEAGKPGDIEVTLEDNEAISRALEEELQDQ